MEWFLSESVKSFLENLYFLSGIFITGSLLIGLRQIYLQRKLSSTAAQREAFRIAAERCDYFGREIIGFSIELKKAFKEHDVKLFDKCKVEIKDSKISMTSEGLTQEDADKCNLCSEKMSKLINSIEGFAVFFVTGVADDNVGFLTCGRGYVKLFEELFPIYALADALDNHCKASQALYGRWKSRIEQLELVSQHKEISKKIDPGKLKPMRPFGAN